MVEHGVIESGVIFLSLAHQGPVWTAGRLFRWAGLPQAIDLAVKDFGLAGGNPALVN